MGNITDPLASNAGQAPKSTLGGDNNTLHLLRTLPKGVIYMSSSDPATEAGFGSFNHSSTKSWLGFSRALPRAPRFTLHPRHTHKPVI